MTEPRTPRMLVVDDEVFVRDLLEDFFCKLGFEVQVAPDGDSALERVSSERFDVALVDLKMPGRDGLDTIRAIGETDSDMLSIVMTGYPTIESSIEALRIGAYDYVIKPFKLQQLKETVDRALKEHALKLEIRQLRNNIEALRAELDQHRSRNNHEPGEPGSDQHEPLARIRQLGELKASGVITDDEFQAKKRELLNRV